MITISPIIGVAAGKSYAVTGTLSGYWRPPSLVYLDDNKALPNPIVQAQQNELSIVLSWNAVEDACIKVPVGACTTTAFSFAHPAMTAAGKHVLSISDGCSFVFVNYGVASADGTKVTTPTDPPIFDTSGNTWSLVKNKTTNVNQIAVNGKVDTGTTNVSLLYYHNSLIYQQATKGGWWYKKTPSDTWHVCPSPLPASLP